MEFNEKLQELRKSKGLTQEELAEKLFVSRTAISKWESGRGYPNIDSIKAISKFFGASLDDLLSDEAVLEIAERESKDKLRKTCNLIYGLFDICVILLLFLPLFGQKSGDTVVAKSLIALSGTAQYMKAAYYAVTIITAVWGVVMLALSDCNLYKWIKSKDVVSFSLSAVGVVVFCLGKQPYPALFVFVFLIIKGILRIKRS